MKKTKSKKKEEEKDSSVIAKGIKDIIKQEAAEKKKAMVQGEIIRK